MPATPDIPQAAAIPVKEGKVCLVTSSNGRHWVIPKGVIDPGHSAAETALQEAWEEAGLIGVLAPQPVGSYSYQKWGSTCRVSVFLMEVTEVRDEWPEQNVRQRCWLEPAEAVQRLEPDDLQRLIRKVLLDGQ
ncbi:MAG: NUDIX hydrolase [Planctomycetes bacterium]|nr:NUDIX hydrolase [Planctomycetota bacterium]